MLGFLYKNRFINLKSSIFKTSLFGSSMKAKLLFFSLTILFFTVLFLGGTVLQVLRHSLLQDSISRVSDVMNQVNYNIDNKFTLLNDITVRLYGNSDVLNALNRDDKITQEIHDYDVKKVLGLFNDITRSHKDIVLQLFDFKREVDGKELDYFCFNSHRNTSVINIDKLLKDKLYLEAINSGKNYAIGHLSDETWEHSGLFIFFIRIIHRADIKVMPNLEEQYIQDKDKEITGVIVSCVRRESVENIYKTTNLIRSGEIFLVDNNNNLLCSSDNDFFNVNKATLSDSGFFDFIGRKIDFYSWFEVNNNYYLGSYVYNRVHNYYLCTIQEKNHIYQKYYLLRNLIIIICILVLLFSGLLAIKLADYFINPLISLTDYMKQIIKEKSQIKTIDGEISIEEKVIDKMSSDSLRKDEIGILNSTFIWLLEVQKGYHLQLENKVEERTKNLEETNASLKQTLRELKNTQDQLIQNERMGAIGNMVAGIAHEINTPIGIAVTGSSFLFDESLKLRKLFNAEAVSRSEMNEVIGNVEKSSELVLRNLQKAGELIYKFKKIAIDQNTENVLYFNVYELIETMVSTFQHRLNQNQVNVSVSGDDVISIKNYPISLVQVLSNLIDNSIVHGFIGQNDRKDINIDILGGKNNILIEYRDNGVGISEKYHNKLFEPFFSKDEGERETSGLGMHIIFKIVTEKLYGSISFDPSHKKGVLFKIEVPSLP